MSLQDVLLSIRGPLGPLSPRVHVVGGGSHTVQLFSTAGVALSAPTTGNGLLAKVTPYPGSLVPGTAVVARVADGGTPSGPPSPAVVVGPAVTAAQLTTLTFADAPNRCVDWVLLISSYPGATVQVTRNGSLVGSAVAEDSQVSVPVSFDPPLQAAEVLEAWQECVVSGLTLSSPRSESLPCEAKVSYGKTIYLTQPKDCARRLQISGLPTGASLEIEHNARTLKGYPYLGPNPNAGLRDPARTGEKITVWATSQACGIELATPVSTTVGPSEPVMPEPQGPICPGASMLVLNRCEAGAHLTVRVQKNAPNAGVALGSYTVGTHIADSTTCEIPLVPGWAADRDELGEGPGDLSLWVHQQGCSWSAPEVMVPVRPLPGDMGKPDILEALACSMLVRAHRLTPGATIQALSNRSDLLELSWPQRVAAETQPIRLARKLQPNEEVHLVQRGCEVTRESDVVPVGQEPPVEVEIVHPVRAPHRSARFARLIVGGRLHVWFAERIVASIEIEAPEMTVSLPMLRARHGVLNAVQEVCGQYSPQASAEVRFGELDLACTPDPLYRGTNTLVTLTATDREFDTPVVGEVWLQNAKVGTTGKPFAIAVPLTGSLGPFYVHAPEYDSASVTPTLLSQPAPETASMRFTVVSHYYNAKIVEAIWSLFNVANGQPGIAVDSQKGLDVEMTPSTSGPWYVSATVTVLTSNGEELALFQGNSGAYHQFTWNNQSQHLGWMIGWRKENAPHATNHPIVVLATA